MAQKTQIILEDDINGEKADETIRFGLDGRNYEIDLSQQNATQLRESLKPFLASARRLRTGKKTGSHSSQRPSSETPKIRKWAQEQGYDVPDRGRINHEIIDQYYQSQQH